MRRARVGRALIVVATAALLAACGADDASSPDNGGADRQQTTTEPERSAVQTEPPSTSGEQRQQALNLEQRHPNGTVLRVTGVSVGATSMTVSIEAVNGFTDEVELNSRGIHLRDDVGLRYNFVEPEQNSDLEIQPGATPAGHSHLPRPAGPQSRDASSAGQRL